MSTSSIGSVTVNGTLQQLGALYQKLESKLASSTTSTASPTSAVDTTDTDNVSGIGKLLSNLEDLATSDPARFKKETAEIAASLGAAASNTTGDESTTFKDLASQIQQASDTGDASALAPKHQSYSTNGSSDSTVSNQYNSTNLWSLMSTDSTSSDNYLTGGLSSSTAASQDNSTTLMSMLNTDSTSASNYLSGSQDMSLNSLFDGTGS
jgi:hypothetical protein